MERYGQQIWNDFYSVPLENSKTMVKYYAASPIHNGVCEYFYPSKKMECRIIYDETKLPYLGCFITAGGFQGDYNCALEPANGYYDSIETAIKNGKCYYLRKRETLTFSIDLELNHTNLSM